ncbi:MAG: hypothetical protein J5859_04990 [Clostridia bacterium]|nr:hypothetical protein [Clostridia bacterium]
MDLDATAEVLLSSEEVKNQDDNPEEAERKVKTAHYSRPGNIVTFGHYEQDNDPANGAEPVEWIVLEKDGESVVLISRYGLEAIPYNTVWIHITWETCSLREWLNGDFISMAFTQDEAGLLEERKVIADINSVYYTYPGRHTQDRVYLLSIREADLYFGTDEERICVPTAYADARRSQHTGTDNSWWWLRSPGYVENCAACIDRTGGINYVGRGVNLGYVIVRPVIVVRISK